MAIILSIIGILFFIFIIVGLILFMIRLFIMAFFPSLDKELDKKGM